MKGTSKMIFTLRSLRQFHQENIMKSTDVQGNYICVCTCMRVYLARKYVYPMH